MTVKKVAKKAVEKKEEKAKPAEKPKVDKKLVEKVKPVKKPEEAVILSENNGFEVSDSNMLVPLDTYLKAGLHIGTKFRTKYMENFIYKVRADGLTVLNVQAIDERLRIAAEFISKFAPEDIVVVGKRENGWRAIKIFAKIVFLLSDNGDKSKSCSFLVTSKIKLLKSDFLQ